MNTDLDIDLQLPESLESTKEEALRQSLRESIDELMCTVDVLSNIAAGRDAVLDDIISSHQLIEEQFHRFINLFNRQEAMLNSMKGFRWTVVTTSIIGSCTAACLTLTGFIACIKLGWI